MRRIPLTGARNLGRLTRIWRGFPILYIVLAFFILPLFFVGLSALYTQHTKGWTVLGVMITLFTAVGMAWTTYWCYYQNGKQKMIASFKSRQRRHETLQTLPDDMDSMKRKIQVLFDHTGAPDDEEEEEDVEKQALMSEEKETGEDHSIENEIQT